MDSKKNFPGKRLILQSLAAFPDNININILLKKEISERKELEKTAKAHTARIYSEIAEKKRIDQMVNFQKTITELISLEEEISFQQKANRICELSAQALKVERVSIWFYDENKTSISTDSIYIESIRKYIPGMTLMSRDYPKYFSAIENTGMIVANFATNDLRTFELTESYFEPLGINSLLDVIIKLEGKSIGIICFEHVGPQRIWGNEEQAFASTIASLISLHLKFEKKHH